jgi:hypothetical protein
MRSEKTAEGLYTFCQKKKWQYHDQTRVFPEIVHNSRAIGDFLKPMGDAIYKTADLDPFKSFSDGHPVCMRCDDSNEITGLYHPPGYFMDKIPAEISFKAGIAAGNNKKWLS